MLVKTLLAFVKGMLAIATALVPASVPAVAAVAVLGSTAMVTAGCGEGDDGDDGGNNDDQENDDGGNDDGGDDGD
ncbi:hypothetical protein [Actinomadura sp. 9N407]|uniref:hypothetical protein n=1 Tax=Actinomadura sp. 9N407 TaxID=3375154 RepID=UPI0037AA6AD1